jgi:hypothetical protein
MSVTTNFYKSVLVQIPVHDQNKKAKFGCEKHKDNPVRSGAKFCTECGNRLSMITINDDLITLEELISRYEKFDDISVHIEEDEGFINVCIYDYDQDEFDFKKGFWCDKGYCLTIPTNPVDLRNTYDRITGEFREFFDELLKLFPDALVNTGITRCVG